MTIPVGATGYQRQQARKFKPGDLALFEALAERTGGTVIKGAFHGTHEGVEFRVRPIDQSKRFILSVVCPFAGRFRITRSTAFDRWLAGFIPAWPLPSRDARFDRDFCVQTRDRELTSRVITDPDCRSTLRALLDGPGSSVTLEGERVKLYGPRTALGLAPDVDVVLGLIAQLGTLGRVITGFTRGHEVRASPAHDAAKIIGWTTVLVLLVLGCATFLSATKLVPLLHPDRFLWMNLGIGLAAVPFAALGLAHLVAGRTAPGKLLVPLVLIALFALPLTTTGTAYLANGLLDRGVATAHTAPITHTHTYKNKSNRRYQVGIDAWWTPDDIRWFRVGRETYDDVRAGGEWSMEFLIRPGWLAQPWIEEQRVISPEG